MSGFLGQTAVQTEGQPKLEGTGLMEVGVVVQQRDWDVVHVCEHGNAVADSDSDFGHSIALHFAFHRETQTDYNQSGNQFALHGQ